MPIPEAALILNISKQYAAWAYAFIFIVGSIGNFINILVFVGHKLFQRNQCAFYLITGAISDCLLLIASLPFHVLLLGFGIDTTRGSILWCKFRPFIAHTLALVSFTSTCLAAFDQYLTTHYHPRIRQLSSLKLAHRSIYVTTFLSTVYCIIFLVFFNIDSKQFCLITNASFGYYYSFVHYVIISGIIPTIVASMFSIFAYLNVRRIIKLQMPINRRKLDKQLTAMVLAKVILFVATILPAIISRIYILNSPTNPYDVIRLAVDQLISNISYTIFYMNSAFTFYVFIMVSPRFRRQIRYTFDSVKNFIQTCCRTRGNQVTPQITERQQSE